MSGLRELTRIELAALVATHLERSGIKVVLSGGACVSIYSQDKYVSADLDFVNVLYAKRASIRTAMTEIGFVEEGRYFTHPETRFVVEFPAGPLAVGDEPVRKIEEIEARTGKVRLLSATDCVKDRLAGYYHWGDFQCLEQARLVASCCKIDLVEIERWSKVEGKHKEFLGIKKRLER